MGDIDVERRGLDIDRHLRSRHRPALDERAEGSGSRADAIPRLAALFVSDKAKSKVGSTSGSARSMVRTASSVIHMPASRSLAPRPRTEPSATAPENGLSRSVPVQRSSHPRVCTVSVWPIRRSVSAPRRPLRTPETLGRPSANSADEASTPRAASSPLGHPAKSASFSVTLGIEIALWSSPSACPTSKASRILAIMVDALDMPDRASLRILGSRLRKHALRPRLAIGGARPFRFESSAGFGQHATPIWFS
jgi:hypothetical protein